MPEIRQLPPSLINKIAAGEVIERPASVVKELMENAVDAGAKRVDVSVEKGGSELLRIADDGCGISPEQLPLAVASHATSKIISAEDLFNVHTLGFRGEALASIAEVSQMLIRSRMGDSAAGAELEIIGGKLSEVVPAGCPVGTTMEVRQLFYNTPVRRKFLRTTQTEMGHVTEAFTRIALVYDNVHFTLRHNDRVIHDLPPVTDWRDRIAAFFGDEIAHALIPVQNTDEGANLRGYVADPSISRANNRMQYLFLNGRHIRDRSLQHALSESYRGLLLTGRYPVAFLRLDIPADTVDVNVHPTKLEVRFQDGGRLYSQILGTIRNRFLTSDLTPRVGGQQESEVAAPPTTGGGDAAAENAHQNELRDWARGGSGSSAGTSRESGGDFGLRGGDSYKQSRLDMPSPGIGSPKTPAFRPFDDGGHRATSTVAAEATPFDLDAPRTSGGHGEGTATETSARSSLAAAASMTLATPDVDQLTGPAVGKFGIQIQNRYLVTEENDGMVIIDQHALHERIMYEYLREKVLGGQLEKQGLLVPETVNLTGAECSVLMENQELLSQLGLEVESFGGDTVAISSYPAMLKKLRPAEILRSIVDGLLAGGKQPDRRDLLDELLHMMSCKAAVKAGDRLSPEEVDSLLQQRHLCQDAHHCPHGRPTALVYTRDELDKQFKRT